MNALRARVHNGRIQVDEPTDLPEGAEILLFPAEDGDNLDELDREALHAALRESLAQAAAGELVDWEVIAAELRASRP